MTSTWALLDRTLRAGAVRAVCLTAVATVALAVPFISSAQTPARVDDSATAKELGRVQRRAGPKPVVAIYDFRSAVPEVQVGAAREMFVTALIRSGAFTVAERQRLNEGVMRERQLSQSGVTAATPASTGRPTSPAKLPLAQRTVPPRSTTAR